MAPTSSKGFELSVTRHIAAPPDTVWMVMTGRIEEWWCPKPWRARIVGQEWRAGGRCAMLFHGPDGETMPQEGIFLEVMHGRRFVTTDAVTHEWQPCEPFMIGIWDIKPEADGTRYTATARHWTEDAQRRHKETGFEQGWSAAADQLAALCEMQGP